MLISRQFQHQQLVVIATYGHYNQIIGINQPNGGKNATVFQ
jgi:hypothetical protein